MMYGVLESYNGHFLLVFLTCAMLSSGCASTARRENDGVKSANARIRGILEDQAKAWNAGDIDAFMVHYWKSPELTFVSGGTVTRGWDETLRGYRHRYPTRAAMGRLTFDELDVRALAPHAALVSGRWRLAREAPQEPVGGRFTLLFRRIEDHWVIVYDHTSKE